jgi:hypothetical protein
MPTFHGQVDQISWIQSLPSKYQVTLQGSGQKLVAVAPIAGQQSVIELAFITHQPLTVEYKEDGPGSWMLLDISIRAN